MFSSPLTTTMAAAFRLVYLPTAAAHFSHRHLLLPPPPPPLNPYPLSLTLKPPKPYLHLLIVQSQAQSLPAVRSESAEEVSIEGDEVSKTRLLVQNVPWTCTVDDIRPMFERFGTVVDVEFSMYNKSRNRGLVFVSMSSHEEALAAITNLESTELEGRVLKLEWAKPKKTKPLSSTSPQPKPMPVHNLYVANLPFQAGSKDLKEFFNANNANVVSAEVIYNDKPRQSAGYGFVAFNTKAELDEALVAFQGKEFMGRPVRVARSKRFLRQGTKAIIESEAETVKE